MIPRVSGAPLAPLNQLENFRLKILRKLMEYLARCEFNVLWQERETACLECVGVESVGDAQHANNTLLVDLWHQSLLTHFLQMWTNKREREREANIYSLFDSIGRLSRPRLLFRQFGWHFECVNIIYARELTLRLSTEYRSASSISSQSDSSPTFLSTGAP